MIDLIKRVSLIILVVLASCQSRTPTLPVSANTPVPDRATSIGSPSVTEIPPLKLQIVTRGDWTLYETPSNLVVYSFAFDPNGSLWIGLTGKVIKWIPNTMSYIEFNFADNFEGNNLFVDNLADVWTGGMYSNIQQYHDNQWREHNFGSPMLLSSDGTIWASGFNTETGACVYHYDFSAWTQYCPPTNSDSRIFDLAIGPDDLLWVSLSTSDKSASKGVWRLNESRWEKVNELSTSTWPIYYLAKTLDSAIWAVGSKNLSTNENGSVKKFDGKNWSVYENSEYVFGIKASDNLLWARGIDYLLRFDKDNWQKIYIDDELNKLFGGPINIQVIGFSPSGTLCVGTTKGVICQNSP